MFNFKKNKHKGFTLAELLIVVAILGVLVAVSIPVFSGHIEKSRNAVDMHNAKAISNAIIYYLMDNPEAMDKVTEECDKKGGPHYVQVSVSGKDAAISDVLRPALKQAGLISTIMPNSYTNFNEITCESKKNWIGYRVAVTNYHETQVKPGGILIYYWGVPFAIADKVHSTTSWSIYQNDTDSTGFKEAMRGK